MKEQYTSPEDVPATNFGADYQESVPDFIGPIPPELQGVPENVARICLTERAEMDSPDNKDKRAFNMFAQEEQYKDPQAFNNKTPGFKQTLDNPDFWAADRLKLQEYGISRQFEYAKELSESMREAEKEMGLPPTIYMLSGVSAAGKTTACREAQYPGMIYDDKGDPIGPLATDNSKAYLYMAGGESTQIHAESSSMMRRVDRRWSEYVAEKKGDCSEVRDKTFSELDDVDKIIDNARETGRRIVDLDIDVPFLVSAVGVMMRPKGSHEPHPDFDYLKENYRLMKDTRREKLSDRYPHSGVEVEYSLKCYDSESDPKQRQKEVAHYKKDDETGVVHLEVLNQELYEEALNAENANAEADKVGGQLITQDFIEGYIRDFFNSDEGSQKAAQRVRESLSQYVGRTVRDVLDDNAGIAKPVERVSDGTPDDAM